MLQLKQSPAAEIYINSLYILDVEERNEYLKVIYLRLEMKLSFNPDFYFFLGDVLHLKLRS